MRYLVGSPARLALSCFGSDSLLLYLTSSFPLLSAQGCRCCFETCLTRLLRPRQSFVFRDEQVAVFVDTSLLLHLTSHQQTQSLSITPHHYLRVSCSIFRATPSDTSLQHGFSQISRDHTSHHGISWRTHKPVARLHRRNYGLSNIRSRRPSDHITSSKRASNYRGIPL